MTTLIVDGSNLLFQMYYGIPARIPGRDGRPVHGVLGFIGALNRIIKMTAPTHLAVLFDSEHDNPRVELLPEYKANRPDFSNAPDDENPFTQLPGIYASLDSMGVRHTEIADAEADDVIAAYALTDGGGRMIISSYDSDFFQLVGGGVTVMRYRGDRTVLCDSAYVQGRYGVPPGLYADAKALVGDSADNIRGIAGVGFKTAAALLGQFGSLRGVIENAENIKRPSIRGEILRNTERLMINYRLIKLGGDAPLPFCADEMAYCHGGAGTGEILRRAGVM